jgi:hypothetical protein
MPVPTPLPYIPARVVEAEFVRVLRAYRMRRASGISGIPGNIGDGSSPRVHVIMGIDPSPRGELPFCLGGKAPTVLHEVSRHRRGGDRVPCSRSAAGNGVHLVKPIPLT